MRADHTVRAIENSIHFVRGNIEVLDPAKSGVTHSQGVGHGDSYIIDPVGEIVVRSRRNLEDFTIKEVEFHATVF